MTDVAYQMAVKEAGSDKMLYAFARYLTHCVQVLHAATTMLCIVWTAEDDTDAGMNITCSCGSRRCMLKSAACSRRDTMCGMCEQRAACTCVAGCHKGAEGGLGQGRCRSQGTKNVAAHKNSYEKLCAAIGANCSRQMWQQCNLQHCYSRAVAMSSAAAPQYCPVAAVGA
jgi:hypothetical protein